MVVFEVILDDSRDGHHRTNTEVLVDILAMAKCNWFLHGLSAVSEAVFYWNGNLHYRSVNLEFHQFYKPKGSSGTMDAPMPLEAFQKLLKDSGLKPLS